MNKLVISFVVCLGIASLFLYAEPVAADSATSRVGIYFIEGEPPVQQKEPVKDRDTSQKVLPKTSEKKQNNLKQMIGFMLVISVSIKQIKESRRKNEFKKNNRSRFIYSNHNNEYGNTSIGNRRI
ncbi:hypothetical protein [Carnobacterium divergens]|uniref:Gram-positive cocci surface proteins LPxTG domain-containing protein n=1 Tax=Carnobacterium divergens TaxID=2748 RepID=A0AAW8R6L8_CARDV|nr:hypothetical protein [Carnobacterium divergens]MDT1957107.1 hypothetical protein [Carnobacterium divergens]MDT1973077.1 hypothetical protein [Carnobacterium divergens]MDT2012747.1 hypothetical protein [Carnobacterium divergens]